MNAEYQLGAKQLERNVLEAELDEEELWECDQYQRLNRQITALEDALAEGTTEVESDGSAGIVLEASR
ncbi:MAG: HalX domain-containing protein [Haloarculaceae archaeon]